MVRIDNLTMSEAASKSPESGEGTGSETPASSGAPAESKASGGGSGSGGGGGSASASSETSFLGAAGRTRRVAQKLAAANESSKQLDQYESYRLQVYEDIFSGSLRSFWNNITSHMDSSQNYIDQYVTFFKQFISAELAVVRQLKANVAKAFPSSSSRNNKGALTGVGCITEEFISLQNATVAHKERYVASLQTDVVKAFGTMKSEHKTYCSQAKTKASKLEQVIDSANVTVKKSFKQYMKVYQTNSAQGVTVQATEKDTWLVESVYCKNAQKFIAACSEYRRAMSEMYISYQKSEVNRLQTLKSVLQKYARLNQGNLLAQANSQELTVFNAAVEQMDHQKEVVLQLKKAQDDGNDTAKQKSAESLGKTSQITGDMAVKVPKPFQSKLILKQSTVSIKAGLFQNWKKYHAVATLEDHFYLFEMPAKGGKDEIASSMNHTMMFSIDRCSVGSKSKDALTFELLETTKGFLGITSTRKQTFLVDNAADLNAWTAILNVYSTQSG